MDDADGDMEALCQTGPSDNYIATDINEAMKLLKPNERTCVTLHLMEDLPIDKVSEITGMPEGTVKSHLARGKEKLITYLKRNGYE